MRVEKLKNSSRHMQESDELLTSLVVSTDRHRSKSGDVILWNKTAEKLFGVKEVDVLGKPLVQIVT